MANKDRQLDKKKIAEQLRAAVIRFNKLLGNAKDARLRVHIYGVGATKDTQISEHTELFVSSIHEVTEL